MEIYWLIIHERLDLILLSCTFYSNAKLLWNTTICELTSYSHGADKNGYVRYMAVEKQAT